MQYSWKLLGGPEMKMRKNAKKRIVAAILCMSIIAVRPVAAFIWPTIDATQIGAFATSLQDGVTQVENVKSQIQNTTVTINTVGDQATSVMKYKADLEGALTKFLPEDLAGFASDVGIADISKVTEITASVQISANKEVAENVVNGTDVLLNDGASEEDVQQLIDDSLQEAEENKKQANEDFDEADKKIIDFSDKAQKSVEKLIDIINQSQDLSMDERTEYISEAEDIQQQIKAFKSNTLDTIQNAREQYNIQYDKKILSAYKDYNAAVSDFYEDKITREELDQAGERLKQLVAQTEVGVDTDVVNKFIQSSEEIVDSIENLKEKIIDSLSNSREYPEDEFEKTSWKQENNMQKFAFSYQSRKQFKLAKSVYEKDNSNGEFFIMPEELADCEVGGKVEDLEDEKSVSIIRKNAVCAKMEKTFWCPDDPESKDCRPYTQAGWTQYEKNGTYKHMLEDYVVAGNATRDKARQYVNSWARGGDGQESTYEKMKKMLETGSTDTRKTYQILGLINLETTKLWSWIRRSDAMDRGQSIIDRLGQVKELYLGIKNGESEADELVQNALKAGSGEIDVEIEPGKTEKALVFSNVFLHACSKAITGEDVSVDVMKKYEKEEIKKKEEQIVKCLFKFAEASNRGTINGVDVIPGNKEAGARLWRKYETAIMQDTAFQTLYLSILGNHKSVKDLKTPENSSDATILSLQKGVKNASVSRDDYTANAEINYYAAEQILDILDAEAQSIQTEILQDLPNLNYNVFAERVDEGGSQGGAK